MKGAGGAGGGGMGLKIMGIRYLGSGKVTANEKVVGIQFVTIAGVVEEFSAEHQRAIVSWDHYLTTFRNSAVSLSNRRRKLIIFQFMNYETVPRDLITASRSPILLLLINLVTTVCLLD